MNKYNIFILLFLQVLFSCKSEKENVLNGSELDKDAEIIQFVTDDSGRVKDLIQKYGFEQVENLLDNPNLFNLTSNEHSFEDDIVFNEVNVIKTEKDIYTIVFLVNSELTDFDKLQKWKVGMYFFAKDPKKFLSIVDIERGYKAIGMLAQPKIMGDEVVLFLENFKIVPKEFSLLRLYLYNNNNDMNKNFYTINNVVFP